MQVKRNKHNLLSLHGAGKHIAKGEASRVLRHLVVEEILVEDVKKSDLYGSTSSVLKVSAISYKRSISYLLILAWLHRDTICLVLMGCILRTTSLFVVLFFVMFFF